MAANQPHVVVVVDDDITVRTTARAILARAGFEVQVADNGAAALALVRQLASGVAVVLLDWTLPDANGSAVLAELQRLVPHARVIVSSGFGREEVSLAAPDAARVSFLEKPYTAAALIQAIRANLEHGSVET